MIARITSPQTLFRTVYRQGENIAAPEGRLGGQTAVLQFGGNAVPSGGTRYHHLLDADSRALPDQHPIEAVTGLTEALAERPLFSDLPTKLPADGGNADTVDGLHAAVPAGTAEAEKLASYDAARDLHARKFIAEQYAVMYATGEETGSQPSGTFHHNQLDAASRALPDQHPIGAVSGLAEELAARVLTTDGRLSDARPASDVFAWAKAATKPVYTWDEIQDKEHADADTVDGLHAAVPAGTAEAEKLASYDAARDLHARRFLAEQYAVMYATGAETGDYVPPGTFYHNQLDAASRALPDQHPVAAVTGLREELDARVLSTDGRLSDARPASDVFAWAKAATKPVYTWDEIQDKEHADADTVDGLHAAVPAGATEAGKLASYDANKDLHARRFIANEYMVMYATGEGTGEPSPGGGTVYHNLLDEASRSLSDQHPVAAITGLREELDARVLSTDGRLSDARPASDVYAWAKAATKPVYTWGEITGKPTAFAPALQTYADWNALAADNYNGFAWGSTNSPIGGSTTIGFSVPFVIPGGDEFSFQMASRINRVYFRNRENGILNAWNELFHTGHLPDWTEIEGKPATFPPSDHTHNKLVLFSSNKPAADNASTYPQGLSACAFYNNGYPVAYGNAITCNGNGSTQLLMEWSGYQTADKTDVDLRMYIRARRDTQTGWTDFDRVAMAREIPTSLPADGGNADTVDGVHFMNASDADIPTGLFGYRASNKQVYQYDADKVAGFLSENGYMLRKHLIDASALDPNTYYPVTVQIPADRVTRIEVQAPLGLSKPSWGTHASGFSCRFVEESNGSGWGSIVITRNIFSNVFSFSSKNPIGGYGQMVASSNEYIYVRGGAKYNFYVTNNRTPVLRTAAYSDGNQTVAPTTAPPFSTGDRVMNNNGGDIVGDFLLKDGKYFRDEHNIPILGTNTTNSQQLVGNLTAEMLVRSGNNDLKHEKTQGKYYVIWDASNANLLSVDWKAKELRTAGTVIMYATA